MYPMSSCDGYGRSARARISRAAAGIFESRRQRGQEPLNSDSQHPAGVANSKNGIMASFGQVKLFVFNVKDSIFPSHHGTRTAKTARSYECAPVLCLNPDY
jgi:hypothetical protein